MSVTHAVHLLDASEASTIRQAQLSVSCCVRLSFQVSISLLMLCPWCYCLLLMMRKVSLCNLLCHELFQWSYIQKVVGCLEVFTPIDFSIRISSGRQSSVNRQQP